MTTFHAPINAQAYKKQMYDVPATEDIMGKLSYPKYVENVEENAANYPNYTKEPEAEVFIDSDAKGIRPKNFTWIENGLFATCSTPVSPTHHEHYKWLMENQVSHLVTLEGWAPKLVRTHDYHLTNINYRVSTYSAPSLDEISEIFQLLDAENKKGKAVCVSCKDADAGSAVIACCYLLRKYRYELCDAIEEGRSMLAVGEAALPRPHYEKKVFEFHMQRLQDGYSNHWFPTGQMYNNKVDTDNKSNDMMYEPAVKDVNNLWKLK